MSPSSLTRRRFVGSVGAVLGTSLLERGRAEAAAPSRAGAPSAPGPVRLDSNENPPKDRIDAMQPHKTWNANAAVLEAALASLDDDAHVPGQRRLMNDTRRWLIGELQKDGRRTIPSEANS